MAERLKCDGCQLMRIQGVVTHEIGCHLAWKDEIRECAECGAEFEPEYSEQRYCAGDNCEVDTFVDEDEVD